MGENILNDLSILKMGYVIQYRKDPGDKFFCPQIEKEQLRRGFSAEDAEFVHVEISGGGQHSVYIHHPRSEVVDIREAHAGRYIRVLRPLCYAEDLTDRKRLKVAYMSAAQSNLGYDSLGCLKFKIPFLFHKAKEFFCSEGCCTAIQGQYPDFLDGIEPYQCMPAHFGDPDFLEVVWEGFIPKKTTAKIAMVPVSPSFQYV